jgi:predicted AAA+ superfamily ATPase
MWIEREISEELQNLVATFPVVVLVGPRQVGITSVLERTFSDYTYLSLDVSTADGLLGRSNNDFITAALYGFLKRLTL